MSDSRYWQQWLDAWDRQQEFHRPGREAAFAAVIDVLRVSGCRKVLDLGCGPGSLARRILNELPDSVVAGADCDPVLLAIAEGVFAGEDRFSLQRVDLRVRDWAESLEGEFDAVVTATTLHWLSAENVRAVYARVRGLLHPGGLFCNLDWMPSESTAVRMLGERQLETHQRHLAGSQIDWRGWWDQVRRDDRLIVQVHEREAVFPDPPAEFMPSIDWHLGVLAEVGFSAVGEVWRYFGSAAVCALA